MSHHTRFRQSEPQLRVAVEDLHGLKEEVKCLNWSAQEEMLQAKVVEEDVAAVDTQHSKGAAGKGRGYRNGMANAVDAQRKACSLVGHWHKAQHYRVWKVGGGFTFVLGWEVVQGTVILLQGLAEVVGSEAVLAHLVVDAAQVVQVERG